MKTLAGWVTRLFLALLLVKTSLYAGFFDPSPDVLTVTDVTEEGRKWPQPEPGKPVLYEALSFACEEFQGPRGDVVPNPRAMTAFIVKTLAEQGYERAKQKGVAKVFLSICWGYKRADWGNLGFLGGDKLDVKRFLNNSRYQFLEPRWAMPQAVEKVMEATNDNLYIASIQAFDLKKVDADELVLLWHTRIACPARGHMMADAVPTMIAAAGPFIGRETKKPVWRDTTELKKERIDFGVLKTLELIEPTAPGNKADEPAKK